MWGNEVGGLYPSSPLQKLSFGVTRVPRFSAENNTRMERSNPR